MVKYKCFKCGKSVTNKILEKRFTCVSCGSKIFFKPRKHIVKLKAI
jgi:DNA-directed RNA polymerase subunit RPC12/RpoP